RHRVVRSRAKTVASLVGATERGGMLPDDRHLPAEQVWDRGGRKGGCLRSERTGQHGPGNHPHRREDRGARSPPRRPAALGDVLGAVAGVEVQRESTIMWRSDELVEWLPHHSSLLLHRQPLAQRVW